MVVLQLSREVNTMMPVLVGFATQPGSQYDDACPCWLRRIPRQLCTSIWIIHFAIGLLRILPNFLNLSFSVLWTDAWIAERLWFCLWSNNLVCLSLRRPDS